MSVTPRHRAAGPVRVGFISHLGGSYGAEKALLEVVEGLTARQVHCHVLLPSEGGMTDRLRSLQVPYDVAPIRWWATDHPLWKRPVSIVANVLAALRVARRLRRLRVDLIYSNSAVTPTGALAAFLLRKPHIWHVHEFVEEDHGLTFDVGNRLAYALMGRLSRCVITNSDAVKRKCAIYLPDRQLRTIYSAVSCGGRVARGPREPAARPPAGPEPVKLVIIGKVKEGKGQLEAIEAVRELVRAGVGAVLSVVGRAEPEYLETARRFVAEHHLEAHVRFTGHVPDIAAVLEEADIALVCSRCEAFGVVTVEAMRFGKPVIGSRSGGTTELIRDGFNGLLYTPGDVHELARTIRSLIEHPDLAGRLGENARRWAQEQFTLDKYAGQVFQVIEEALGAHAACV